MHAVDAVAPAKAEVRLHPARHIGAAAQPHPEDAGGQDDEPEHSEHGAEALPHARRLRRRGSRYLHLHAKSAYAASAQTGRQTSACYAGDQAPDAKRDVRAQPTANRPPGCLGQPRPDPRGTGPPRQSPPEHELPHRTTRRGDRPCSESGRGRPSSVVSGQAVRTGGSALPSWRTARAVVRKPTRDSVRLILFAMFSGGLRAFSAARAEPRP
jgi:hypothetical protein